MKIERFLMCMTHMCVHGYRRCTKHPHTVMSARALASIEHINSIAMVLKDCIGVLGTYLLKLLKGAEDEILNSPTFV